MVSFIFIGRDLEECKLRKVASFKIIILLPTLSTGGSISTTPLSFLILQLAPASYSPILYYWEGSYLLDVILEE
jgi:hypothetical protein